MFCIFKEKFRLTRPESAVFKFTWDGLEKVHEIEHSGELLNIQHAKDIHNNLRFVNFTLNNVQVRVSLDYGGRIDKISLDGKGLTKEYPSKDRFRQALDTILPIMRKIESKAAEIERERISTREKEKKKADDNIRDMLNKLGG